MRTMTDLEAWVKRLIGERYGTADKIAKAIGMTSGAFGRGVKRGTLSAENLLQLADLTGEAGERVLRMGGKGDVADLIARLFGAGSTATLPARIRQLAQRIALLPEPDLVIVERIVAALEPVHESDGPLGLPRARDAQASAAAAGPHARKTKTR